LKYCFRAYPCHLILVRTAYLAKSWSQIEASLLSSYNHKNFWKLGTNPKKQKRWPQGIWLWNQCHPKFKS
jgi:hypothetical protein